MTEKSNNVNPDDTGEDKNNVTPDDKGTETPDDKGDGGSKKVEVDSEELEGMKKTLRESQKMIKSLQGEKAKKEEDDMLKKGEHEKLIASQKEKISTLEAQVEELTTKSTGAEEKLKGFAEAKITKFKSQHGEENLNKIKEIVGDDPIVLSEKLDSFEGLIGKTAKLPSDKSGTPSGKSSDRKQELRAKATTGRLSHEERKEYRKLMMEGSE